MNASGIY